MASLKTSNVFRGNRFIVESVFETGFANVIVIKREIKFVLAKLVKCNISEDAKSKILEIKAKLFKYRGGSILI